MSSNIHQIFLANPTTTFVANDLMYLGRSPYSATDDFAFTYSSLIPVNTKGDLFTWSTAATKLGVGANGTLLTPDSATATGLKWTTATYPATTTINQLLYSSSANTVTGLATANNSVVVTDGTGIPSLSTTLPTAVQGNITSVGIINSGTWQGNAIGIAYGGTGTTTTFTAGSVVFAGGGGTYTQDNAKFFWDDTNDRLGIGTATPSTALDVIGSAKFSESVNFGNTAFSDPTDQGAWIGWNRTLTGATTFGNQRGLGVGGWEWLNYGITNVITNTAMTLSSAGDLALTGNVTSGTWEASIIGPTFGGTGLNTYATGDLLYASAANTLAKLGGNTTTSKMFLSQTGNGTTSAAPVWEVIDGTDVNGQALTKVDDTNVTLTLGGTPSTALLTASSITAGWTGQLSLARGGTNANLTADEGGIVYSSSSALAILAPSFGNKPLVSALGAGAPHWSGVSFPDSISANAMLVANNANILSELAASANSVVQSNGSGVISFNAPLAVAAGGSGTSTAFTTGSVVFAGASGVYTQDNAAFFWNNTDNRLGLGTNSPSQRLDVEGVINIFDTSKTYGAGLQTEANTTLINFGINDTRFGTPQSNTDQGGVIRIDSRSGEHLYQFLGRPAASSSSAAIFRITSQGDILFGPGNLATNATVGFPSMPGVAGAPSGAPTNYSGNFIPFVWDSTNDRLRLYDSGWKYPDGNILETYSPTIGDGTNNFTMSTQAGWFIRVGRVVHFWTWVVWTGKGSASGNIEVSMPVAKSASIFRAEYTLGANAGITWAQQLILFQASSTGIGFTDLGTSGTGTLTDADFAASGEVQLCGTIAID